MKMAFTNIMESSWDDRDGMRNGIKDGMKDGFKASKDDKG